MSKFLRKGRPTLVGMLYSHTEKDLLREIETLRAQGADAFGLHMEKLLPEERNRATLTRLFSAMRGLPAYVTDYARGNMREESDEELTEALLTAADCGATLIDIRADLFDRSPEEFTEDERAIEKQKSVIKTLHAMGAEVLMSSHILKFLSGDEVLRIARAQAERGADIAKIVTSADSEAELRENLKTTLRLAESLPIPSLFLCNGSHCRKHRILGPTLGSCMFLTVENANDGINQPTLKKAVAQLRLAGYRELPSDA